MRIKLGDKSIEMRAVWFENNIVKLIDQRYIPDKLEIFEARSIDEVCFAIKEMVVRGAPAIGVTAAYGVAQSAIYSLNSGLWNMDSIKKTIEDDGTKLKATRPTAYDLFYAVDYIVNRIQHLVESRPERDVIREEILNIAEEYCNRIVDECYHIGLNGAELIKNNSRILTHCNAGALATVDYGTALAPMRIAKKQNKKFVVYVDETRPRLQGAKLTSWELYNEDIEHYVIPDNAAGYYMAKGDIDIVIVGGDRVCANGDFANKIGTYEKAVLAREHNIPFYVAVPRSSIDFHLQFGSQIKIESRNGSEVRKVGDTQIIPEYISVLNPAFDVTPAKFVTGYITKWGIFKPEEIYKLQNEKI